MVGHINALSKYQQGCRFLQKKLDEGDPQNTKLIFNELLNHLIELMKGFLNNLIEFYINY